MKMGRKKNSGRDFSNSSSLTMNAIADGILENRRQNGYKLQTRRRVILDLLEILNFEFRNIPAIKQELKRLWAEEEANLRNQCIDKILKK
jgi:hypothetical protein